MTKRGASAIRAAWADVKLELDRQVEIIDPLPEEKRGEHLPGQWPGAPVDKLPPGCPVTPLGINGHTSYYIDTAGQLLSFDAFRKEGVMRLFRIAPNFLPWAWPRWSEPKEGKDGKPGRASRINGFHAENAIQCLEKAAGIVGPFDAAEKIRGRGAWSDEYGRLIWHSGDALWRVENGKLKQATPGRYGYHFYPRRPPVPAPWLEPVGLDVSPAPAMFKMLNTWTFERGSLDAVLAIGGIGVMLIGGSLRHRPHLAAMGDFGVGKTELQAFIKGLF